MKRPYVLRAVTAAIALVAAFMCSCDEYPVEEDQNDHGAKLRITVLSGDNQTERVGMQVPDPIVVRVSDILNNPKPGVPVFFTTSGQGAVVAPSQTATDGNGLASCMFKLGTNPGAQHVRAFMRDDTTTIAAVAVSIACTEESPRKVCLWPGDHIYIATTGSSLHSSGPGSVILDFDPATKQIVKVLETSESLDGLAFSSRGELFATALHTIFKVNHATQLLETYLPYLEDWHISLEPNEGGILGGLSEGGPMVIKCPEAGFMVLLPPHVFPNIKWENCAADPVTRDLFMIAEYTSVDFRLWRIYWDGRSSAQTFGLLADLPVETAVPRGMCADSAGTVYITFDGNDNYRRIVSVAANGTVNEHFFDFFAHAAGNNQLAGRWGDIAYLGGRLYVIDRRNDRLVIISRNGVWLDEVKNTAFSRPFDESEHYAIAASPEAMCATTK